MTESGAIDRYEYFAARGGSLILSSVPVGIRMCLASLQLDLHRLRDRRQQLICPASRTN
jgi:hypothetical protein